MRRCITFNSKEKEFVLSKFLSIVYDRTGVDLRFGIYEKQKDFKLNDDLGIDSLDKVELIMELEDKFKIQILDEEIESINTIGEVFEIVYDKNLERWHTV